MFADSRFCAWREMVGGEQHARVRGMRVERTLHEALSPHFLDPPQTSAQYLRPVDSSSSTHSGSALKPSGVSCGHACAEHAQDARGCARPPRSKEGGVP